MSAWILNSCPQLTLAFPIKANLRVGFHKETWDVLCCEFFYESAYWVYFWKKSPIFWLKYTLSLIFSCSNSWLLGSTLVLLETLTEDLNWSSDVVVFVLILISRILRFLFHCYLIFFNSSMFLACIWYILTLIDGFLSRYDKLLSSQTVLLVSPL